MVIKQNKDQELSNSHKMKNYEILKNLHRNKFNRVVELNNKKENITQKQAKAKANRDKLIEKKINIAKFSYTTHFKQPLFKVVETPVLNLQVDEVETKEKETKLKALMQKLQKADALRTEIEAKKINKAKELYTKYGPSEA